MYLLKIVLVPLGTGLIGWLVALIFIELLFHPYHPVLGFKNLLTRSREQMSRRAEKLLEGDITLSVLAQYGIIKISELTLGMFSPGEFENLCKSIGSELFRLAKIWGFVVGFLIGLVYIIGKLF